MKGKITWYRNGASGDPVATEEGCDIPEGDALGNVINPLEYLKREFNIVPDHITYDPNVIAEYEIIRGSKHDGTLIFTYENINRCLEPLIFKRSFCKTTEPDWSKVKDRRYIVGNIQITSEYKRVDLPCGNFPGQEEVVKIPVRVEYIFKDGE